MDSRDDDYSNTHEQIDRELVINLITDILKHEQRV